MGAKSKAKTRESGVKVKAPVAPKLRPPRKRVERPPEVVSQDIDPAAILEKLIFNRR